MRIEPEQIREYRLRVHHLDEKMPADSLLAVAGVCGLQNSPPGAPVVFPTEERDVFLTALLAQEECKISTVRAERLPYFYRIRRRRKRPSEAEYMR